MRTEWGHGEAGECGINTAGRGRTCVYTGDTGCVTETEVCREQ